MVDPEFDELVERSLSESLAGRAGAGKGERENQLAGYLRMASEISRVLTEESPRLTTAAQARHLAQLRERAASKRGAARFSGTWLLHAAPRWALVAGIAIILVIITDGITIVSAGSLPGSPLYPVKRLAEQSVVLLAPSAGVRARIWMDLASRRLDEAQRLLAIQPRVDQRELDDIDESILHALTEVASTRGTERIALLQQIIQLALREQTVLDDLAQKASTDDRARFQQSARLLSDVVHIADSAQSNLGSPIPTPIRTHTGSAPPSATLVPTEIVRGTPVPTMAPSVQSNPPLAPAATLPRPNWSPTPQNGRGSSGQPSETPELQKTETPEWQKSGTPEPSKSDTPQLQKTETPEAQRTESPDAQNTLAPTGE